MVLVENKCKCLLWANLTAKLTYHHVLDMQNITYHIHAFLILRIRMHESATAHLLHPDLYSKEKSFIFNHFMIRYINNLTKSINNMKFLSNKNILVIQNPVKRLQLCFLWKNRYIKIIKYYFQRCIIYSIVKCVVTERFSEQKEQRCNLKLLHTNPNFPNLHCWLWTRKCQVGYCISNVMQYS